MKNKLQGFLDSSLRNVWLSSGGLKVYIRKGMHLGTDGKIHKFLDIASASVSPRLQKQGRFKNFLLLCQTLQIYDGIYCENVLNEHLRKYFQRLVTQDSRWAEKDECFIWETYK
jgi:hypothetical protein